MSTRQLPIFGIPCTIRSPAVRHAIHSVLEQIRSRAQKDFARIVELVRAFVPLPNLEDGTLGEWKPGRRSEEFNSQGRVELLEEPGVVELAEDAAHPIALIAHELGHVC